MSSLRLQKALAQAGVASRRRAEQFIREGRVRVNGRQVTEMGVQVDPETDVIEVDGKRIDGEPTKLYLILNKPRYCLTTLVDPKGRPTVADLIPKSIGRVFPVGRLDWDAEGLLLLTNDGELSNRLMHPRYGVSKTYQVKVIGRPGEAALQRLRSGIKLKEGTTAPAEVVVVGELPKYTWLQVILHQGWYRQIKRMGQAVGHPVVKIRRSAYGPIEIGNLAPGKSRPLNRLELEKLRRAAWKED